jgi:hypothetical protein
MISTQEGCWQGSQQEWRLAATSLPDLTPVAPGGEGAEGDARLVFTWQAETTNTTSFYELFRSYLPSGGGAPRLIADLPRAGTMDERCLGVWDSGTSALLHVLEQSCTSLVTYQRQSDGVPGIAAGLRTGGLHIRDGDDFRLLRTIVPTTGEERQVDRLLVYRDLASGRTRLVSE